MISENDRNTLKRLIEFARDQVLPLTTNWSEVQAVGEFWEAIELWMKGTPDDVQVDVSVGIYGRGGTPDDFEEHRHVDARVNADEVRLDTLLRTYSRETGSDHESKVLGRITKSGWSGGQYPDDWFEIVDSVKSEEGLGVSVSRDHL